MNHKIFGSAVLAAAIGLGAAIFAPAGEAATREEMAAMEVSPSGDLRYWTEDSVAKETLVSYVRDVTNMGSENFIPVADRIAVFDMDGTFLCETAPYYFEWMLYLDRAIHDANYTPKPSYRKYAEAIESAIRKTGEFPKGVDVGEARAQQAVFAGMTPAEYEAYVRNFMEKPVEGLTNLKWGEAFYLPMVEVIKYLQANDFTVYVVSGSDRPTVRILSCEVLGLAPAQVIGSDTRMIAAGQGDKDGLDYLYGKEDYLVRGQLVEKVLKMNKVSIIAQEIGQQPVLAFGNSNGDSSMLNYTVYGNKYKSASFMVLCDDLERELGNIKKAEKCRELADTYGWTPISMRDDFATIYGDDVTRTDKQ